MQTWVFRPPHRFFRRPPLAPTVTPAGTGTLGIVADSGTVAMVGTTNVAGSLGITADSGTVAMSGATYYFADEFEGATLDLSRWSAINRIEDQSNSEIGCDEPSNITLTSNMLSGVSQHLSSPHSCGDAYTAPISLNYSSWSIQQKKGSFIYPPGGEAVIDIRWKPGGGTGLWPAFWMLGRAYQASQPDTADVPGQNWPNGEWCELDIAEFLGNARTSVNCQIHNNGNNDGGVQALAFNASSQMAVYRLKWSSGSAIWQVDDESGGGFTTLLTVTGAAVPAVPMYVICNAAMGGNGGGTPDPATLPQTTLIDYIRVTALAAQDVSDTPLPVSRRLVARNTLLRM